MKDDSEILKAAFPDYSFSLQTTSDPSQFYTLKKGETVVFISYYPEDEVDEEMYLMAFSLAGEDTLHAGFQYNQLQDVIAGTKEKIGYQEKWNGVIEEYGKMLSVTNQLQQPEWPVK